MTVSRRNFARLAAAGSAVAVASPAIAQQPSRQMAAGLELSEEPSRACGARQPTVAKFVSEMSDGKFDDRQPSRRAKSCPACRCSTPVANGTVECGHSYAATTSARIRR